MPIVSKVTLPSGNEYDLRDNSQGNSDHQHYYTNLVPLVHKVYESTSYYATTSGDVATATWFFASVRPDSWYKPWRVNFKYHTYCTANAAQHSYTLSMVCGRSDASSYANFNEVQTSAHYYTSVRLMKKAGFDYGLGHAIGISIYASSNYTNSAYYRTFEIDYLECENCTVTILDTPVLWANWQNNSTTYYNGQTNQNAVDRGLQETGDANTTTGNRISYFAGKTGAKGIWANGLFMEDQYGTFQNICTGSDGTVTSSSRTTATTKIANTNGFKVCGTIFYTSTTYNANSNISGDSVIYSAISIIDTRYSFNTTLTSGFLTTYKPLYLVGTIHEDGLFYLDTVWWTQTPTDTSKVYVLVGGVFDSTTSNCRATLYEQNKWYRYDGEMLIEIFNDAITVNGHTVETDVPEDAVFTDTTYSDGTGITIGANNEINHSNSVTAQTTQKVYPIKIDAQGHISAYGTSPTTLSGYGITDAKIASGTITLGSNTITPLTASSTLDATKLSGTIPASCYTDTKNTAGSTDTSSKIFLIGATEQSANPQTYSQDTAYVGTDGCLYSGGSKVLTAHDGNNAVTQSSSTTENWRKVILSYQNGTSGAAVTSNTQQVYATTAFECQPSTGTVKMTRTTIGNNVTLEFNSTTQSLDFVFE